MEKHIKMSNKPLQVIYNGIARVDMMEETKPDFIKDKNRTFFFTIGQVRRNKNFGILVDVMKSFPDRDLYICGNNQYEYAQEIQARLQNENITNVIMPVTIKETEKAWMYKHCEVFLFPSTLEGFGIQVLEAMLFNKPVFPSNQSSLLEVCGGHAFLWSDFNVDNMVGIIHDGLARFRIDEKIREEARCHALKFSYERNIETYLALYRQILGL